MRFCLLLSGVLCRHVAALDGMYEYFDKTRNRPSYI